MSEDNSLQPVNMLLSREELLLVLNLLQAETIPGLDGDPLGPLTDEGQALALTMAGRALRARELAQVGPNGDLAIHTSLLTAVGVCAYANSTIFVYHWPSDETLPVRYFGHLRGEVIVAHTRPEDVLHLFTLLPTKALLMEQVLAVCEYEEVGADSSLRLKLSSDHFVRVRELTAEGEENAAVTFLTNSGESVDSARAFVSTLADSARVSIWQTLKQVDAETVQKRDVTLIQNKQYAWFVVPMSDEENAVLLAVSTTRNEILKFLNEWL